MENPIAIINDFIDQCLDGNIEALATYDLKQLRGNNTFGCKGRKFDCDDTTLMRAIYCVAFGDVWKNLSMENSGKGKMRGDTINSFGTFFSYPWDDKFTPRWNPPAELSEKIKEFLHTFHTIGNMMVLPDRRIDDWSINTHRGCHDDWHDYEDRFLNALHRVLTDHADMDLDLKDLVEVNFST